MFRLQKGDKVAFVAPSCRVDSSELEKSLKWFSDKGLKVELMPHVFSKYRYMAGNNAERAADICEAFSRKDIKALFCVRGGAGSACLLDLIDYDCVRNNQKPIFGLSDSTALQNALFSKTGNISYSGFLPVYDFKYSVLNDKTEQNLNKIFCGEKYICCGGDKLIGGRCEGILVGGCLSVFCQLCGTPYFPDLKDKIILIEDVGEKSYKIEMLLNQLRLQKDFSEIKGLVFGQFKNCLPADEDDGTVDEIISDFVKKIDVPVLKNFAYGHELERHVLPIGGFVCMDADAGLIEVG